MYFKGPCTKYVLEEYGFQIYLSNIGSVCLFSSYLSLSGEVQGKAGRVVQLQILVSSAQSVQSQYHIKSIKLFFFRIL